MNLSSVIFTHRVVKVNPLLDSVYVYYRVIALMLVNIVPSWDIEGRKLVFFFQRK